MASLADATTPVVVTVVVPSESADQPVTQRLAWMLVSLLTRNTTVLVTRINLVCPVDVHLLPLVAPRPADDGTLMSTLLEAAALGGPDASPVIPVTGKQIPERGEAGLVYVLNPVDPPAAGTHSIIATGWAGEITAATPRLTPQPETTLPFGAYTAACLAAAQVFLSARATAYEPMAVMLDAWHWTTNEDGHSPAPVVFDVKLGHVLGGVGAVGTACLLTLWATAAATGQVLAIDADAKGVDVTNLNRCLPFTADDIDKPKAETAANVLTREGLTVIGKFDRAENHVDRSTHLISAVDTPEARQALQDKYPASAVQASTRDLRLEVLRVDPTTESACLRCYNPPKPTVSDEDLRKAAAAAGAAELQQHAASIGTTVEELESWAKTGGCGELGDAILRRLRATTGSRAEFSVGFVSVLAGVLLAARVIQDAINRQGSSQEPLQRLNPRYVLTLLDTASVTNGPRPYARDRACPCCSELRRTSWLTTYTG